MSFIVSQDGKQVLNLANLSSLQVSEKNIMIMQDNVNKSIASYENEEKAQNAFFQIKAQIEEGKTLIYP